MRRARVQHSDGRLCQGERPLRWGWIVRGDDGQWDEAVFNHAQHLPASVPAERLQGHCRRCCGAVVSAPRLGAPTELGEAIQGQGRQGQGRTEHGWRQQQQRVRQPTLAADAHDAWWPRAVASGLPYTGRHVWNASAEGKHDGPGPPWPLEPRRPAQHFARRPRRWAHGRGFARRAWALWRPSDAVPRAGRGSVRHLEQPVHVWRYVDGALCSHVLHAGDATSRSHADGPADGLWQYVRPDVLPAAGLHGRYRAGALWKSGWLPSGCL
mmetsp:Transcript_25798/g.73714  ORF Transcript_25798/g.73714 Transcript_25798/m.73714 type:complete len:268 (-) Transcript_25798:334-1137(-)